MKKEYLLLMVAIIGLAALLVYQKKGRTNYQLPKLTKINDSVDRVVLEKADNKVELRQVDGSWVVGPKSYRADNARAAQIVDEVRNLQLVALISEKENYPLYELSVKKRLTVKLFHGKTLLREVMVGKNSASLRQTYVMLKGDHNVYQALGNLKSNLFFTVSDLRDKEVLKLTPQAREKIDKITLERLKDGKKERLEMVKLMSKPEVKPDKKPEAADKNGAKAASVAKAASGAKAEAKATSAAKAKKTAAATTVTGWQLKDGRPVSATAVSSLLNSMSNLKCKNYLENLSPDKFKQPVYRVTVNGAGIERSIAFLNVDGSEYKALSSSAKQPFLLPSWQAQKLVKDFAEYTGAPEPAAAEKK